MVDATLDANYYQRLPSSSSDLVMASSANLGERLDRYVSSLVESGRYQSRSEVLREGVRLVEEREKRLEALDAALARGLADADAGRVTPIDVVAERLITKYRAMAKVRDE